MVIKVIARALLRASLPPLDERLKSILATQIGELLKGGYPVELVERIAIELALLYDEGHGHNRLTRLARRVRVIDLGTAEADHEARKVIARAPVDARVAALFPVSTRSRPHPSNHAFQRSDQPNTCAACDGPVGVHVRSIGLDDEGNEILVSTDIVR